MKIMLFLPDCLRRSKFCDAKFGENGLDCKRKVGEHEGCCIPELRECAIKLGYKVVIASGPSMVKKIYEKEKPDHIVGVACEYEAKAADKYLNVPHTAVRLLKDGCIDTEVNVEEVKRVLNANSEI